MCEPTLIIAGISAGASLFAAKQAADAQDASNQVQRTNTLMAQVENANQVTLQRGQQAEAAGQKINANNMALREAQGTAVARGGPSGLSMDALLGSMAQKGATYNESVNANLDRVNMQLDNQLTNVNRGAASEVNSLKTPAQPDYLGAALRVGSAAYGSYGKGGASATYQSNSDGLNGLDRLLISNRGSGD